ncbi:uncharacterized protein ACN427_012331 [Glossina fuscipes fuscipes]
MSKLLSILLPLGLAIAMILGLVVWSVRGSSCSALNECDSYIPVCAAYRSEHQFFYSQCDMVRENCMTGKIWERDHFSHCNHQCSQRSDV